jgi:hypothetical protein
VIHESNTSTGIGLAGAVFLVFLILKLMDKIDWSWWWVTSPLWLLPAIVLVVFLVVAVLGAVTR